LRFFELMRVISFLGRSGWRRKFYGGVLLHGRIVRLVRLWPRLLLLNLWLLLRMLLNLRLRLNLLLLLCRRLLLELRPRLHLLLRWRWWLRLDLALRLLR